VAAEFLEPGLSENRGTRMFWKLIFAIRSKSSTNPGELDSEL
jgi:hypothetical protein